MGGKNRFTFPLDKDKKNRVFIEYTIDVTINYFASSFEIIIGLDEYLNIIDIRAFIFFNLIFLFA